MRARARRWVLVGVGWIVLLVGIALFPLPGSGLLVMVVWLGLLAEQQPWAERLVDRLKASAIEGAARGVETPTRAVASVLGALALAASGLLWVWAPTQPAWWVLPAWTWLPGGLWAGVGQALSGLVTLALVVWSIARSRRTTPSADPDRLASSGTMPE